MVRSSIFFGNLVVVILLFLAVACGGTKSPVDSEGNNQLPTAEAGDAQTVNEKVIVTLSGSAQDADGSITAYNWTQVAGGSVTIDNSNMQTASFTAPIASELVDLVFQLEVTDNGGAKASDQVTISVQPVNEINLTLQGKVVIDNTAITTTNVVVSIDDLNFNTSSNAQGEYSVQIEADEVYSNKMVVITAAGVGEQADVKLISSGFDVQAFTTSSGEDSIVNAAEHIGVNVTYLSTAMAALAQIENAGVLPLTKKEFTEKLMSPHIILSEINASDMATVAKLVTEFSANEPQLKLPAGIDNTYDLLSNLESLTSYFRSVKAVSQLEQKRLMARQTIKQNANNKSAIPVVPEFYTANLNIWVEEEFAVRSENPFFRFNQDGTGVFRVKQAEQRFTWVNSDSLKITFANGVIDTYQVENGFGKPKIQRQTIYDSIELFLTASADGVDLVRYQVNWRHHYPNNELPDAVQAAYDSLIYVHKKHTPLTIDEVVGTRAIPLYADIVGPEYNESPSLDSASFSFFEDGRVAFNQPADVQTNINLNTGVWSLSDDGVLMLVLNEAKLEVRWLYDHHFSVHVTDLSDQYLGHNLDFSELRKAETLWTVDNVAGIYSLEPKTYFPEYININVMQLNADNTGQYIEGEDENEDGIVTEAERITSALTWTLTDGKLVVNKAKNVNGGSDWIRTLDLFKVENNRYHHIEQYQYELDLEGKAKEEKLEYNYLTKLDVLP